MTIRSISFWGRTAGTCVLAFASMHGIAYGQAQAMNGGQGQAAPGYAQVQTASACGNQPRCYDAPTFAAVITDFRTSEANGFKVIDVVIRYFNKTNQTRSLGYVDGSAAATDDQG